MQQQLKALQSQKGILRTATEQQTLLLIEIVTYKKIFCTAAQNVLKSYSYPSFYRHSFTRCKKASTSHSIGETVQREGQERQQDFVCMDDVQNASASLRCRRTRSRNTLSGINRRKQRIGMQGFVHLVRYTNSLLHMSYYP